MCVWYVWTKGEVVIVRTIQRFPFCVDETKWVLKNIWIIECAPRGIIFLVLTIYRATYFRFGFRFSGRVYCVFVSLFFFSPYSQTVCSSRTIHSFVAISVMCVAIAVNGSFERFILDYPFSILRYALSVNGFEWFWAHVFCTSSLKTTYAALQI